MSNSEKKVECEVHGKQTATFVCNHLVRGDKLGFNYGYDPEYPDDLYPDAWCDECESVLEAEGEWNEKSEAFADIKVLCSTCYEECRERNWIQDDDSYHDLISSSFQYLQDKQDVFAKTFRINHHERWDWYQETGLLIFSHEGKPQVEAKIDFSGSISTNTGTWMWAWANESLTKNIKLASQEIRAFGEKHGYLHLAAAHWPATVEDGWEMTAIMAKQLGATGAYRTPNDYGYMYMVIREARWVNA